MTKAEAYVKKVWKGGTRPHRSLKLDTRDDYLAGRQETIEEVLKISEIFKGGGIGALANFIMAIEELNNV